MARTRGKSGPGNPPSVKNNNGNGQSDSTGSEMSTSISQPDLLGDLIGVNKANGGGASDGTETKKNGFHSTDEMQSESTSSPPSSPSSMSNNDGSDLPDVSVVISSNSSNNPETTNLSEDHVELVA